MNHLNVWKFALATAVTFAALSALCAIAAIISPEAKVAVFSTWLHGLDLKLLMPPGGKPVTAGQVISGVISAAVVSFVGGAILAGCYNLFSRTSER
jgi:2TM family of unknown function (DUF5676)